MTPLEKVRSALEDHGAKLIPQREGILATCPAHEDGSPSLSVREGHSALLVKCFAGCKNKDVVKALGLNMRDLFDNPRGVTYTYTDARGATARTVTRTPDKDFRQKVSSEEQARAFTLYRLPEILAAVKAGEPVWLVEGEKDAENLVLSGVQATTAPQGSSSFPLADVSPLRGATVHVVPDQDAAGEKWTSAVAAALAGVASSVTYWRVPEGCKDFSDLYATGAGVDALTEYAPEIRARRRKVLVETPMSEIKPLPVSWLWKGYVPFGEITALSGREKEGKSTLAVWLAARVTRGDLESCPEPGTVLWLTSEDSPSHVLAPRLMAAGADMSGVILLNKRDTESETDFTEGLTFPEDLHLLAEGIRRHRENGPVLLVVDPITSVLSQELDTHSDHSLRGALDPLRAIAEDTGAAILVLHHLNKSKGGDLGDRMLGARTFSAVARSVLGVVTDPDDEGRKVLYVSRGNLCNSAEVPNALFAIQSVSVQTEDGPTLTGAVKILGEDHRSEAELTRDQSRSGDAEEELPEVSRWLRDYLTDKGGEAPRGDVVRAAKRDAYSESAVKRAAKRLNVESVRAKGMSAGTVWRLPPEAGAVLPPRPVTFPDTSPVLAESASESCSVKNCDAEGTEEERLGGRTFPVCPAHYGLPLQIYSKDRDSLTIVGEKDSPEEEGRLLA